MAESSIPVDLLNPGQVFASIGLLEAADLLLGSATGGFSWNGRSWEASFRIRVFGSEPPVERVMAFLEEAEVIAKAPPDSLHSAKWIETWGTKPEISAVGDPFPFPDPDKPATLPALLRDREGNEIPLDYWGDATRDNVKFWAGSRGMPGAALLRDAVKMVRGKLRQCAQNPFALSGVQTSSFRFDWRRDYVPIQIGFSINRHKRHIKTLGFPLVEILAAIGVSHARPRRGPTKLEYRYGVVGGGESILLEPMFHRAALGAAKNPVPGCPFRQFVMHLDWPGKEGDARCITQVTEEETNQ